MAHRKPLGTTCRTTCDWLGDTPQLGDYLVTQAGTWYRVVGIEEKANPQKLGLVLERIAGPDCASPLFDWAARIFEFEWYPRDRQRAA